MIITGYGNYSGLGQLPELRTVSQETAGAPIPRSSGNEMIAQPTLNITNYPAELGPSRPGPYEPILTAAQKEREIQEAALAEQERIRSGDSPYFELPIQEAVAPVRLPSREPTPMLMEPTYVQQPAPSYQPPVYQTVQPTVEPVRTPYVTQPVTAYQPPAYQTTQPIVETPIPIASRSVPTGVSTMVPVSPAQVPSGYVPAITLIPAAPPPPPVRTVSPTAPIPVAQPIIRPTPPPPVPLPIAQPSAPIPGPAPVPSPYLPTSAVSPSAPTPVDYGAPKAQAPVYNSAPIPDPTVMSLLQFKDRCPGHMTYLGSLPLCVAPDDSVWAYYNGRKVYATESLRQKLGINRLMDLIAKARAPKNLPVAPIQETSGRPSDLELLPDEALAQLNYTKTDVTQKVPVEKVIKKTGTMSWLAMAAAGAILLTRK